MVRSRTIPALLTRMSIDPNESTAVAMIRPAALEVAHRVVVGDRVASGGLDLLAHVGGRVLTRPVSAQRHPDVVDHDLGPFGGQAQRDVAADPSPGSGHHCYSIIEKSHLATLPRRLHHLQPAPSTAGGIRPASGERL